jgi:hypothetical protein
VAPLWSHRDRSGADHDGDHPSKDKKARHDLTRLAGPTLSCWAPTVAAVSGERDHDQYVRARRTPSGRDYRSTNKP